MPEEIMQAAVRWVADNALHKHEKSFEVSFHGEGEPTANWALFTRTVEFAEDVARIRGLSVEFTMSTNAMWKEGQREFIVRHFRNLSVSFDGNADVQNRQRPAARGTASFPRVVGNLKALESAGVAYGLRTTVLPDSVGAMIPMLDFVGADLKCDWIHYEPVFVTGRAEGLSDGESAEFHDQFLTQYHRAVTHGARLKIHVAYSGCRTSNHGVNFCGVTGPDLNFFVSTRGIVSSCYEVIKPDSPKGRFTVYGRYEASSRSFLFDEERLSRLRRFSMLDMAQCRNCFVRWNCGGDCFARSDLVLSEDGTLSGNPASPRCRVNQETTLYDLVRHGVALDLSGRNKATPQQCNDGVKGGNTR
jgi:uncharacterized protein